MYKIRFHFCEDTINTLVQIGASELNNDLQISFGAHFFEAMESKVRVHRFE